jgi:hypothetical protein
MAIEALSESEKESPPGGVSEHIDMDRDKLLSLMSEVIGTLQAKIQKGRIRDPPKEKLRLEAMRVLFYGTSVYNAILKDKELDAIERRLEVLENANKEHGKED